MLYGKCVILLLLLFCACTVPPDRRRQLCGADSGVIVCAVEHINLVILGKNFGSGLIACIVSGVLDVRDVNAFDRRC